MREREMYPPGVPCWIDTMQPDPDAAKQFYGDLFGWKFDNRAPAGSPGPYFVAQLEGYDVAAVGGPTPPGSSPPFWNPYTSVESVDRTAARVKNAGGKVLIEPTDVPNAGRLAKVADPEGAVFSVWEPGDFIGAQLVNEPGTWNFSELNTRDPDSAKRFYAAVFEWEIIEFGMGESSFTFFVLPGYGDFLVKANPELRRDQAADGAHPDFADAVSWLVPMSSDQTDPPHWSVTFAVDDADAAASRAQALGGTVLVPPFDAEPVRMTVIRDPQGAVFTASKYQPSQ